jgi:HAE1 family hydrophobic/amphiphilic exporter-1
MLTLLVIPSFYDSIEISRDRALAKFHAREVRWNPFFAFVVTLVEALFTLVLLRALWRVAKRALGFLARRARLAPA